MHFHVDAHKDHCNGYGLTTSVKCITSPLFDKCFGRRGGRVEE